MEDNHPEKSAEHKQIVKELDMINKEVSVSMLRKKLKEGMVKKYRKKHPRQIPQIDRSRER